MFDYPELRFFHHFIDVLMIQVGFPEAVMNYSGAYALYVFFSIVVNLVKISIGDFFEHDFV